MSGRPAPQMPSRACNLLEICECQPSVLRVHRRSTPNGRKGGLGRLRRHGSAARERRRDPGAPSLFADLTPSQLEAIAHSHDEDVFAAGQRVLRQGVSGGNFYVILEGEAGVEIDGEERHRLGRGRLLRRDLGADRTSRRRRTSWP